MRPGQTAEHLAARLLRSLWAAGLALILACSTVWPAPLAAQASGAASGGVHLQVVLLIDASGSMVNSDPQGLRKMGSQLFVDLLDQGDSVGVVSFANTAQMLAPLSPLGQSGVRQRIKDAISKIPASQNTDILAGMRTAYNMLVTPGHLSPAKGIQRAVILLTDGVPDPPYGNMSDPSFAAQYMGEIQSQMQQFAQAKVRVYTIGLGAQADVSLLRSIAVVTHAEYHPAGAPSELASVFLQILSSIKQETVVNLSGQGTDTVATDPLTKRLVLVAASAASAPVALSVQPPRGGAPLKAQGQGYAVLSINSPARGQWQLTAPAGLQLFAMLNEAVHMTVEEPQQTALVPVGQQLPLAVRVTMPKWSGGFNLLATVTDGAGQRVQTVLHYAKQGATVSGARLFTGALPPLPAAGSYQMVLSLRRATAVLATRDIAVYAQSLPALQLVSSAAPIAKGGGVILRAETSLDGQRYLPGSGGAPLHATAVLSPMGKSERTVTAVLYDNGLARNGDTRANDGIYAAIVHLPAGRYRVTLRLQGVYAGQNFLAESLAYLNVAPKVAVTVSALSITGSATPGGQTQLWLKAAQNGPAPITLSIVPTAQSGLDAQPLTFSVPPAGAEIAVPVRISQGVSPGARRVLLNISSPTIGVLIYPSALAWTMQVLTPGEALLQAMRVPLLGLALLLIALGAILLVRRRRLRRAQSLYGRLSIELPHSGEPVVVDLGRLSRPSCAVGGTGARDADVVLEGLPAAGLLFSVDLEPSPAALRRHLPPTLRVNAIWPHHVYFGEVPRNSQQLFHGDRFQVAGLSVTFEHPGGEQRAAGTDPVDGSRHVRRGRQRGVRGRGHQGR